MSLLGRGIFEPGVELQRRFHFSPVSELEAIDRQLDVPVAKKRLALLSFHTEHKFGIASKENSQSCELLGMNVGSSVYWDRTISITPPVIRLRSPIVIFPEFVFELKEVQVRAGPCPGE